MSDPIRLRIPSKPSPDYEQSQPSSVSVVKRRSSKRRLVDSDSDEEYNEGVGGADTRFEPPPTKRARTVEHDDVADDADVNVDMNVDVDGDADISNDPDTRDTRFLSEEPVPTVKKPKFDGGVKKGKKSWAATTSGKKKRQVVYSDDEDPDVMIDDAELEDDDLIMDDGALPFLDVDDDEFEPESVTKRSKGKTVPEKGKAGKRKPGALKSAKGKGKEKDKDKEILMKDERKSTVLASRQASTQPQAADLFIQDEQQATVSTATEAVPEIDSPSAAPPTGAIPAKKIRKLPPIKKTKQASTGTSTPLQALAAPAKPPPESDLSKLTTSSSTARKPAALIGAADFDLRDKSVYAELFKGPGGSTPRSGLNRREKEEERRKELNKMRDEARAKRAEEAKHTFDLQAQAEKIARFEQRLKEEGSTALHPNFLAAKFRDEHEYERRQRGRTSEGRSAAKEEGEA
ncbi:hypothetical protein BV22DRAFT_1053972 [Leucogyrophana mollusca]|uniref:Uncharacterized protein n=1 Tax=Leucogyrophana mollusca TaxID=85980 RepID=A0ACB8BZ22_9AGAM|nr:hypothetical protein BV22DRAFT_1053972 [Leucogyrophana mollusca]